MLLILTCFISIVLGGTKQVKIEEPAWFDASVCHGPQPFMYSDVYKKRRLGNVGPNGWNCTRDGCNQHTEGLQLIEDDIVLAEESCQDLGDGVPRCYWVDPNVIFWGEDPYEHRICTWHGDAECLRLDGTSYPYISDFFPIPKGDIEDGSDPSIAYMSCLRCCPNKAVGKHLCTETISTKQEQCGTIGEVLLASYETSISKRRRMRPNYQFGNIAPCCPGEVCLDNLLGICGAAGEACDECTKWSFIKNGQSEYHSGDSCGDGFICLDDGSIPIENYKPLPRHAELNYYIPPNLFDRRRMQDGDEEPIIYQKGICVPIKAMGECSIDEECGDCLRCCEGKCKRIAITNDNQECGLDGKGPCCKYEECYDNDCITSAPTPSPTQLPTPAPTQLPTPAPTQLPTNTQTPPPTEDD